MIFGLFVLVVALTISAVAAYYSIAGLCAIFAAAVVPVIIMGAALEAGKIVATVWLHKFWHRANIQFKLYLIPAIVVLMIITSMGIFGFLSKAHMDQTVTVGDSSAQVAILDEKIKTEKDNIEASRKALTQMDAQVDQLLGRTDDDKGANRAVQVRKQQAKERKALQSEITAAQKNIAALQAERAPLAAQTRKIEAEVGPIKYIAALIYGDNPDANLLERAVRWVIILLVLVFDPLALVLILAAEQTIEWARADRRAKKAEGWHQEWVPDTEAWPPYDHKDNVEDLGLNIPLDENEEDKINITNFFKRGKGLGQFLDSNDGRWFGYDFTKGRRGPVLKPKYELDDGPLTEEQIQTIQKTADAELGNSGNVVTTSSLFEHNKDFSADEFLDSIDDAPANDPKPVEPPQSETPVIDDSRFDPQPIRPFEAPATDEAPINPIPKAVVIEENQIAIPDTSISVVDRPANASFGTEFPLNPQRGDMFLRVDYLPNRSYKWNGQKWIDINSEQYAYDEEYIKHLIDRIDRGEYSVDLLSETEQEQIQRYLNEQSIRK